VLGVLLGAAMQAHPLDVLLGTPSGRLLCLVGVALDAAGLLWTRRLTSRAERP
jgi:tight adherence protein B